MNILRAVMGHESASTTLTSHTHAPSAFNERIRDALGDSADDSLTEEDES